jgi:hypothetical protein
MMKMKAEGRPPASVSTYAERKLQATDRIQNIIIDFEERYEASQIQGVVNALGHTGQYYLASIVSLAGLLGTDQDTQTSAGHELDIRQIQHDPEAPVVRDRLQGFVQLSRSGAIDPSAYLDQVTALVLGAGNFHW